MVAATDAVTEQDAVSTLNLLIVRLLKNGEQVRMSKERKLRYAAGASR